MVQTFWHSSSHVLGEALEAVFGADLTIGPAIDDGFYYDCYLGERTLGESDKEKINKKISEVWLCNLMPLCLSAEAIRSEAFRLC